MLDLNTLTLAELYAELTRDGLVTRVLEIARDEDLGAPPRNWEQGDVTTRACIPGDQRGTARIGVRGACVVSGLAVIPELLHVFRADVDVTRRVKDGDRVEAGTVIAELSGSMRAILGVERTMLNVLGRLCGIATRTAAFAEKLKGTKATLLDTRKTTPGLRVLEKYAVRCGGGHCHRVGLYDAVMIKDNHLATMHRAAPSGVSHTDQLAHVLRRARADAGPNGLRFIELEVDSLDGLREVIDAGLCGGKRDPALISVVLLDNMNADQIREAVAMRDSAKATATLEASGGVTLDTIGDIARTGVERISTGSITHAAAWADIGLDMD